jgi:hypothetical protein
MRKEFLRDLEEINNDIEETRRLMKESVSFYEDDDMGIEEPEMEEPGMEEPGMEEPEMEPEMTDEPMDNGGAMAGPENEPYSEKIRKFAIDGLSSMKDNPDSEDYQMLKKIFQMCDKKTEKKAGMNESHRVFGIMKESRKVILEARVANKSELTTLKKRIVKEAREKGINPADIRLVSENKIIL